MFGEVASLLNYLSRFRNISQTIVRLARDQEVIPAFGR